ncbi:MAG TPA: HEAT repeat domain-containing protein [Thermodesulfobacteriota bacterium]|nr:HEAT repeat domain-containing protein [Thermodesulfobacteriota bacterium]
MIVQKNREVSLLSRKVEAFASNLLHLIRGARVYPAKHPTLLEVAKNVLDSAPLSPEGSLTIGITSKELIVSGEFVAGKASNLASMLHARKVLRLLWTKDVTLDDVWTFARVITGPKLEGDALRQKLRSEVFAIDIEPLKLDQIHSEIVDTAKSPEDSAEERRRHAWLALMIQEAPPEQLVAALDSDEFWEAARAEWMESGRGDSEGFTKLLLKLGDRLENALALLPDRHREKILGYLAQIGKCLSAKDLVRIIGHEGQESGRLGPGRSSLLREIDGERFVDLLAGLAAMGNQGTRRFAEVYRRFAPLTKTDDLLSLVRSRLAPGKDGGFAAEVWKTIEDFIINLAENPFMDAEYSESLEFLMNPSVSTDAEQDSLILHEEPEEYLDQLILALAGEEEEDFRKRLLDRIRLRAEQIGPFRVLGFVKLVDRTFPGLLDTTPFFVRELFQRGLSALATTSFAEQQALVAFAVNHERCLLDTALKALTEEKKIATRHFLVSLLSCFSSAATPTFVTKARTSPWYVARNLAIVLGQQGLPQGRPTLQALSNHPHPKVVREAIKALKRVPTSISHPQETQQKRPLTEQNGRDHENRERSYGAECP